jgi:hypothetical protein
MRLSRHPSQIQIMIDQKRLENVKYFNYLGCIKINYATRISDIKSRIAKEEPAFFS